MHIQNNYTHWFPSAYFQFALCSFSNCALFLLIFLLFACIYVFLPHFLGFTAASLLLFICVFSMDSLGLASGYFAYLSIFLLMLFFSMVLRVVFIHFPFFRFFLRICSRCPLFLRFLLCSFRDFMNLDFLLKSVILLSFS